MQIIRDVDPGIAAHLPADFVSVVLPEINYCDQSEAPPTKAIQTHALFFNFDHTPPGLAHSHIYKGLLVYSPPLWSMSLGTFSGTGALVAHSGTSPEAQRPSPWVRIVIAMRRSAVVDPATLEHRVFMGADFYFLDSVVGFPGAPGPVERLVGADFDIHTAGISKGGGQPFLELTNVPEGDRGKIRWTRTTVVP